MADDKIGELRQEARKRCVENCGKEIKDLPMPTTTAELLKSVENQNRDYKHFRGKSTTLLKC